jgi:hypothetical protein
VEPGYEEILRRTCEARNAFWFEWGDPDPDLLVRDRDPALHAGPHWPGRRQAFRTVRRGSLVLVASDGLSDPFADPGSGEGPGFGLELFAVTKDPAGPAVRDSWLLDLVHQASQEAAARGGLLALLGEAGLVLLELHDVRVPAAWRDAEGKAGVLLGLPPGGPAAVPASIRLPQGSARAVCVKLLTPSETARAASRGAAGREEIAALLAAAGPIQRSSLGRDPVA